MNSVTKVLVTYKIYTKGLSLPDIIDYKIALLIATLSIMSNQLLIYSSIINLKYINDHYVVKPIRGYLDVIVMISNYLMLTCFGIATTVIPMELLEILRLFVFVLTSIFCCCDKKAVDKVSYRFNQINQSLTMLTVF